MKNRIIDKSQYMIVKIIDQITKHTGINVVNHLEIPVHDRQGKIEFYNTLESAEIDRMYYPSDIAETLKILKF